MRARDLMADGFVSSCEDDDVRRLLGSLHERGLPGLPVVDAAGRPAGWVSQADVLRALDRETPAARGSRVEEGDAIARGLLAAHAARSVRRYGEGDPSVSERRVLALLARPIRDIMNRQVTCVDGDVSREELADLLVRSGSHRIIVTREGRAVGLVTASDVLKAALVAS